MSLPTFDPKFDSTHPVAYAHDGDDHELEAITDFNFDAVDRSLAGQDEPEENTATMGEFTSALPKILYWATGAVNKDPQKRLAMVGGRVESLLWLVAEDESRYKDLTESSKAAGCTKQCVSKALLNFKDDIGLRICAGKRDYSRESY